MKPLVVPPNALPLVTFAGGVDGTKEVSVIAKSWLVDDEVDEMRPQFPVSWPPAVEVEGHLLQISIHSDAKPAFAEVSSGRTGLNAVEHLSGSQPR